MLDYFNLQTSSGSPTFLTVLYAYLLDFILVTLIALIYRKTTLRDNYSKGFIQSLVLSSFVATIIMQAIGDSLALGLGMIGALSIVRFRTTIDKPRDISFIFAALALGIATGVYAFEVAAWGAAIFSLIGLLLHYSPYRPLVKKWFIVEVVVEKDSIKELRDLMEEFGKELNELSFRPRKKEEGYVIRFEIEIRTMLTREELIDRIEAIQGVETFEVKQNQLIVD